ncbi:MAG TPA: amidase, partial [Stellaceae bacterium]|nr:amidase [Stellaceae bacterium]
MDPTQLTIAESIRAIAAGSLSPVALTEAYLDRIAALDGELHSYVLVLRDQALKSAQTPARGVLHGIPIGLKDIYKTRGIRTTAGSRRYLDHIPDEDAETWVRLRNAGAILLGKNETHEFAIGGPDFTLPFAPARNPWNTAHYPAGSSSGSAVAVAAGLCAGAMGSDTGG